MRIYLSRPHMSKYEQHYVGEAFSSNFIAPIGPQLNQFEESVQSYLGNGVFCVAMSSGSAALHLALIVSGVGAGDKVWVSSMTFAGGVFPITYIGATPVFFDVSPQTWTLDVTLLEEQLVLAAERAELPSAIVSTDLYGQSSALSELEALASQYHIKLIIDSAESLGAEYLNGRKCGTGGDAAILSFNGNKIITTSGGGMLVSRDKALIDRARFLSTQARDQAAHYQHSTIGYNYRLSNICAAIGLGQMHVLDERVDARRKIYERYKRSLQRPGFTFMPEPHGYRSSHWLTTATIDPCVTGVTTQLVQSRLLEELIETRPLWKPMHLQPVFSGSQYYGHGFDEALFTKGICLPSGSDLTESEQEQIISLISSILDHA